MSRRLLLGAKAKWKVLNTTQGYCYATHDESTPPNGGRTSEENTHVERSETSRRKKAAQPQNISVQALTAKPSYCQTNTILH